MKVAGHNPMTMRHALISLIVLCLVCGCSRPSLAGQARMPGNREFSPQAWAAASQTERGEMLASFLVKHPVDQLTAADVKQLLGPPTGYADYDEDPAYVLGPPTVQSEYGKAYLPIFVTDERAGRVMKARLVPEVTRYKRLPCLSPMQPQVHGAFYQERLLV